MARNFQQRYGVPPNQNPPSDATVRSNSYDGSAPGSAFIHQDQALLGVAAAPMSFPSFSTPRSVPSGFADAFHRPVYNNPNAEAQGQQDELMLTSADGVDFHFSFDGAIQSSSPGSDPTFQLPRHRPGIQHNSPWVSIAATGVPVSSRTSKRNSHSQAHLSPQHQAQPLLRTPSRRSVSDEGYYTLSTRSQQDARNQDTDTIRTTESLQELYPNRLDMNSGYEPSISGSNMTGTYGLSGHGEGDHTARQPQNQQQAQRQQPDEPPIECSYGDCRQSFATPSQLNKHKARHDRPHKCNVTTCKKARDGFSTVNDLDRHRKTVHKERIGRYYRCFGKSCINSIKEWPRLDNFKNHLDKLHHDEDTLDLIRQSDKWYEAKVVNAIQQDGTIVSPRPRSHSTNASFPAARPTNDMNQITTMDPRYLIPGTPQHNRALGNGQNPSYTGSPAPRTLSSSLENQGPASERGNVSNFQLHVNSQHMVRQWSHQSQYRMPSDTNAQIQRQDPGAARHRPSPSLDRGHDGMPEIRYANVHLDNQAAVLSLYGNNRHGGSGAKTAPNPDMPNLSQRLVEADSVMPQRVPNNPVSDGKSLLAFTSASHLGCDAVGETSPGGIILSAEQSPAASNETRDDQIHSILQSVRLLLPGGSNGSNHYDLVEVVKATIKSVQSAPRGSNSTIAMTPSNADIDDVQKMKRSDGKEVFVCSTCKKETGRQSEMNKHLRRHTKPYGCTFDDCNKIFGSKNDLKRHEHSQHEQPECWRCQERIPGADPCFKLYLRRDQFIKHLQDDHRFTEPATKEPLRRQRISRMHQTNYWCGFCRGIQTMAKKGVEGDNERFDHIVNHFIVKKQNIDDWLPAEGKKTKGEIKAEKERENERNASESKSDGSHEDGDSYEGEGEDDDDEMDDGDLGSGQTSPVSSQKSSSPEIEMEQQSRAPLLGQSQPHLQQTPQRNQPQHQQYMQTPPATNKRRKLGSDDTVSTEASPSQAAEGDRHMRRKPAKYATCCRCQYGNIMLPPEQSLALSKKCLECQHTFCKEGCVYR